MVTVDDQLTLYGPASVIGAGNTIEMSAATPEPAGFALAGSGFLALWGLRFRRWRRA